MNVKTYTYAQAVEIFPELHPLSREAVNQASTEKLYNLLYERLDPEGREFSHILPLPVGIALFIFRKK